MAPWWALIVAAAIGGVFGLVAGLGGSWLTSRATVRQWRRQQQIDAYQELAVAATHYQHTVANHFRRPREDPAFAASDEQLRNDVRALDRAGTFVQLVAPRDVQRAVVQLMLVAGEEMLAAATNFPRAADAVFMEANMHYIGHLDEFMMAASRALGFPGYVPIPAGQPPQAPTAT